MEILLNLSFIKRFYGFGLFRLENVINKPVEIKWAQNMYWLNTEIVKPTYLPTQPPLPLASINSLFSMNIYFWFEK